MPILQAKYSNVNMPSRIRTFFTYFRGWCYCIVSEFISSNSNAHEQIEVVEGLRTCTLTPQVAFKTQISYTNSRSIIASTNLNISFKTQK